MSKRRLRAIDALRLAMDREREAGKFYRQAVETVQSSSGQIVLNWLVKEKEQHLARLRRQINALLWDSEWLDWTRAFAPVSRAEFPSPSEALGEFVKDSDDLDVSGQAVESERAAVAFYMEVGETTPDVGGKAMFRLLADEEQGHADPLEEEVRWFRKAWHIFRPRPIRSLTIAVDDRQVSPEGRLKEASGGGGIRPRNIGRIR